MFRFIGAILGGAKAGAEAKAALKVRGEFDAFWKHIGELSPVGKRVVADGVCAILQEFHRSCLARLPKDHHWNVKGKIGAQKFLADGNNLIKQAHANVYSSEPSKVAIGYAQGIAGYYVKSLALDTTGYMPDAKTLERGHQTAGTIEAYIKRRVGEFVADHAGKELPSF